jgi:magnesium transporter
VLSIDAEMQPLFRDVSDHIRRVQEDIDSLREVLAFAFEASLMAGQAEQTAITRKLAAWAAILAVPTAVAGIYGMNFEHMPELKWLSLGRRGDHVDMRAAVPALSTLWVALAKP